MKKFSNKKYKKLLMNYWVKICEKMVLFYTQNSKQDKKRGTDKSLKCCFCQYFRDIQPVSHKVATIWMPNFAFAIKNCYYLMKSNRIKIVSSWISNKEFCENTLSSKWLFEIWLQNKFEKENFLYMRKLYERKNKYGKFNPKRGRKTC